MSKKTIGIIGLGDFGGFLAGVCPKNYRIFGHDSARDLVFPKNVTRASLQEVAKCDIVVLAVPLSSYERVLPKLAETIDPKSVLVDVCSVKVLPERYVKKYMPRHNNLLITHPLFGPQSAAKSTKRHHLIVTNKQGELADKVLEWCRRKLGLEINEMDAKSHDQTMAYVHALTFFVARGLNTTKLPAGPFKPPSYNMLLELAGLHKIQSRDLFETVEKGNPYAKEVRDSFVKTLSDLNDKI